MWGLRYRHEEKKTPKFVLCLFSFIAIYYCNVMLSPNFSCIFLFYGYHRTKSYHGYILSNSNNHIDQVTLSLLNRRNILTVFGGFFKVFMPFECYNPNNIRCAINSIGWEKNVPFRILVFRHFGRSALCIVCLMVVIVLLVLYLSHAYRSKIILVCS